jgi:hypothetical protein
VEDVFVEEVAQFCRQSEQTEFWVEERYWGVDGAGGPPQDDGFALTGKSKELMSFVCHCSYECYC